MRRQLAVTLMAIALSHTFGSRWPSGVTTPSTPALPNSDVELAPALVDHAAEAVDAGEILEVERDQRRSAALGADGVVELLQPAGRARHRHNVRAGFGERQRRRVANAARRAGDDGDASFQTGHRSAGPGGAREGMDVVGGLAVGQPRRIGAGEAGIAELRRLAVAVAPAPTAR